MLLSGTNYSIKRVEWVWNVHSWDPLYIDAHAPHCSHQITAINLTIIVLYCDSCQRHIKHGWNTGWFKCHKLGLKRMISLKIIVIYNRNTETPCGSTDCPIRECDSCRNGHGKVITIIWEEKRCSQFPKQRIKSCSYYP